MSLLDKTQTELHVVIDRLLKEAHNKDARATYIAIALNMLLGGVRLMRGINIPHEIIADIFLDELFEQK